MLSRGDLQLTCKQQKDSGKDKIVAAQNGGYQLGILVLTMRG
jgi:hypothetical protein